MERKYVVIQSHPITDGSSSIAIQMILRSASSSSIPRLSKQPKLEIRLAFRDSRQCSKFS